ncbi:holo-ACP synthase [Candidatus Bandiella euplotis]|uniref:Holo-[acyl-carrier-protein] synthase n=1 Tax=Candidatus Bandiella euplotis TaxID=1664265 RepID=A0ABZ0UMS4_9RICK|nr:holo-ACP synthase [Candidatus Bandiella woodruffii]WPX96556.1 Holo-[acyl-carrier-protein] synthase [Candidatus Bandiella woodruffii]
MIVGIGCDIVDIRRVERLIKKYKYKFLSRIFTENEIKLANNPEHYSYFAKRFAAKEAYAKATGHGIRGEVAFQAIEIFNDAKNAPFFNKHPMSNQGVKAFLSIADEYPYTIAYVILETLSKS